MFDNLIRMYIIYRYKIYEDLKIISEVAKDESDSLGPKFWTTLK